MVYLLGLQCALGVAKIVLAFTPWGRKRFCWHSLSGSAILALGVGLLWQDSHRDHRPIGIMKALPKESLPKDSAPFSTSVKVVDGGVVIIPAASHGKGIHPFVEIRNSSGDVVTPFEAVDASGSVTIGPLVEAGIYTVLVFGAALWVGK